MADLRSIAVAPQSDSQKLLQLGDRLLRAGVVDRRDPHLLRGCEVERQVIDVHAVRGLYAGPLDAELIHAPRRLADALLSGDHDAVEELVEHLVGVAVYAPGVRHE